MFHTPGNTRKYIFALCLVLILTVFCGCEAEFASEPVQTTAPPETTVATLPTEPEPTIPVDGNPDDVTCKGSYTADVSADSVVATIADTQLTNGQLQVLYWLEVAAYRQAGHEISPDFTQSLDTQVCPLDDSVNSWQQYFLREALNSWASAQALTLQSQLIPLGYEKAYQPNADKHAQYFVDVPVLSSVYYGISEYYRVNELHQTYLDNLPTMLSELSAGLGYTDTSALAAQLNASEADLLSVAEVYNRGYMYFTELTYDIAPTAEDVEIFFSANEDTYAQAGITRDSGKYVDMRHILMLPTDATIADDGTVTAEELRWTQLYWKAQTLKDDIRDTYPHSSGVFGTYAANNSMDLGSAQNGGLYENVTKGQLMEELDSWLFDERRKSGDTSIIRTTCGTHIVYFIGSSDIWYETAEADLTAQMYAQRISAAENQYPMQVDYSAICLGAAEIPSITMSDLLYPDISHERYPSAPLYLQQDYPTTKYGAYSIVTHGCGITTISMLATYMSDTELTPPTLCARYGRYCTKEGSDRTLFVHTPGDMGFYLKKQVFNSKAAYEALEQGYIVVCLQHEGMWTAGGHFLLLEHINEDGTIQVRDSNIYNYSKLDGHKIDRFEWSTIPPNASSYWIYYPKYTSCSQCVRCADGETAAAPDVMFNSDYLCSRCENALLRRNAYLN